MHKYCYIWSIVSKFYNLPIFRNIEFDIKNFTQLKMFQLNSNIYFQNGLKNYRNVVFLIKDLFTYEKNNLWYILYIKDNILDSILKDPSEFSRMVNLGEEWEVLTQVTKHPETCQGYIPTLWEISRWISANEGTYNSTCMNYRSYIYSALLHIA